MKRLLLILTFIFISNNLLFAQSEGDFRSRQTGNWTNSDTWEEFTGGAWTNTANTPTNINGVITILSTHQVTVAANVNIDQTFVNDGGEIIINSSNTLTVRAGSGDDLTINSGGLITNNGTLSIASGFGGSAQVRVFGYLQNNNTIAGFSTSTLFFEASSEYNHASSNVSIPRATWNTTATCYITGLTSAPNNMTQSWGNLFWNTPSLNNGGITDLNMGSSTVIKGDFTIQNTGSDILVLSDQTITFSILGDLIIQNSSIVALTNTGDVIINLTGNFNLSSDQSFYLAAVGSGSLRVGGDFNFSNGDITNFGSGAIGQIVFNNGSLHTFQSTGTYGQGAFDIDADNVNLLITGAGTNVQFLNNSFFGGGGDLTVEPDATISLASTNSNGALQNSSTAGNIRNSGNRFFASNSSIEYSGATEQSIGDGFPTSDVNLVINNTGGDVNLSADLEVSAGRVLTLNEGILNIGPYTLTLNGTVSTTNGGVSGGGSSSLVIGGTNAFGTLGFAGTNSLLDFTINRTSSGSVTLGGDLTVLGTFTQTAGDLNLNGNTLTLSGDYNRSAGSLNTTASSVLIVNGVGTLPNPIPITGSIQKITLNRASSTFNTGSFGLVADTLNAYSGTFNFIGSSLTVADGGFVERQETGSFNNILTSAGSFDVNYNIGTDISTGNELPTSTSQLNNLTKQGGGNLTLASNITINGDLDLQNGTFDASTQSIDLKGDLNTTGASVFENASFTFSGFTNVTGSNAPTFGNITITGTFNPGNDLSVNGNIVNNGTLNTSAGTVTFGGTTTISGSNPVVFNAVDITGSLTAPSAQSMTVNGNFANTGTFDANGGIIVFGGNTSFTGTTPDLANVQIDGILNAPTSLAVSGDFNNNGTFNHNSGLLDLTGTGTRSIGGSSALSLFRVNLSGGTINNENAAVSVIEGVTIDASTTFDADGSGSGTMTLVSTASDQSAYFGVIPASSSVTGNINVQRYFSVGRFWRYLGSPVANTTVADWQEEFPVTGTFSDPSTGAFDGTTLISSNPSLFYWDASISEYVAYPTSGSAATNSIEQGRGYSPYVRNSISNIIGEVTGVLNQQSVSLPVAFDADAPVELEGNSWNLVANPYAAPIDWDAAGWTKTNIANEVHIPRTSGGYATYIGGVAANGGSQYIASGQAFWVRATASSPVLSTAESIKSVGQDPVYFREAPLDIFKVRLAHGSLSDEVAFAVRPEAEVNFNFDESYDAKRLLNISGFGYTLSIGTPDSSALKINSIPSSIVDDCDISVPLLFENVTKQGGFTFSFEGVEQLSKYYNVTLFDQFENRQLSLSRDENYLFDVTSDAASKDKYRFYLLLSLKEISNEISYTAEDICQNGLVNVEINNAVAGLTYELFNGQELLSTVIAEGDNILFELDSTQYSVGENSLSVMISSNACRQVMANQTINFNVAPTIILNELENKIACKGENVSFTATTNLAEASFELYSGETLLDSNTTGTFSLVADSTLDLTVKAISAAGCVSDTQAFQLAIESLGTPQITVQDNKLVVTLDGVNTYKWYLDGEILENETDSVLIAQQNGSYQVEVFSNTCSRISEVVVYEEVITSNKASIADLKLYPNPVSDYLNITGLNESAEIIISTVDGKVIKRAKVKANDSQLNLKDLNNGIYIIQFKTKSDAHSVHRIVKK